MNILMLDTAPLYGNGRSEKIIGSFLKNKDRKKMIFEKANEFIERNTN